MGLKHNHRPQFWVTFWLHSLDLLWKPLQKCRRRLCHQQMSSIAWARLPIMPTLIYQLLLWSQYFNNYLWKWLQIFFLDLSDFYGGVTTFWQFSKKSPLLKFFQQLIWSHLGHNKTLPKALQTQALTALTSNFGRFGRISLVWYVWFGLVGLIC